MSTSPLLEKGLEKLKSGEVNEAQRLFDEHEAQAGTAAQTKADLSEAEAKLAAGDVGKAATLFESILDRNPGLTAAYLGLTRIALFTNLIDDAKTYARAAVKLAPENPLALTLFGLVHEASNDVEGALPHVLKGAALGPKSFLCQFNAGRVLTSVGRAGEGLPYLLAATALEPSNADAFNVLGYAHKQLKQSDKALAAFEKVTQLAPRSPDAWATLADVLFEVKEYKTARAVLDRGLSSCGDHPALLEKALACVLMMNDPAAGLGYVERELKVLPDHEQGFLNLAYLQLLTKDLEQSEATARRLLQKNPQAWEAWLHLGDLFELSPQKEAEAEAAYRKAIDCAPKEWKPRANFGALLVQSNDQGKHAEAKQVLEQAIALAPPGEHRPRYNLALALVRLGDVKQALELAVALQQQVPSDSSLHAEAKKLERTLREKQG